MHLLDTARTAANEMVGAIERAVDEATVLTKRAADAERERDEARARAAAAEEKLAKFRSALGDLQE